LFIQYSIDWNDLFFLGRKDPAITKKLDYLF
jgi:hypothetical protein